MKNTLPRELPTHPQEGEGGGVRWPLIIFGIWTAYGLVTSGQQYLLGLLYHSPVAETWWKPIALQMPQAWFWAAVTPLVLWLGRLFPFDTGRWLRAALVHLVICFALVFLVDMAFTALSAAVLPPPRVMLPFMGRVLRTFMMFALSDSMMYWIILAVGYAAQHYQRRRQTELTASQLETQLVQAELQALKMQFQPHFLFNALHTIGSLVRTGDRANAVKVTAGLGDLLRRVLESAARQEVTLRQEIDFIRRYLEIEQIRFQDRLKVEITADESVLGAMVPYLILQPLVENAIRHGIEPHRAASTVTVDAQRMNGRLTLIVRDDGPGVGEGHTARPGIGLSNTRERLVRLYGKDFDLVVQNCPNGSGLEARVELPYRGSSSLGDRDE